MKNRSSFLLALACVLAATGCDDTSTTTGTGGSTSSSGSQSTSSGSTTTTTTTTTGTTTGSSTSSGMTVDLSECQSDPDCPGGKCVDVNGGFKTCQVPVEEATSCNNPGMDACCNSSECKPNEKCVTTPVKPVCAGIPQPEFNTCAADECATNDDCNGGVCVPAGTFGNKVKACLAAQCTGICGLESMSPCAIVRDPCCNTAIGFFCIDECNKNQDCPGGYCEIDQTTMSPGCKQGSPPCPL